MPYALREGLSFCEVEDRLLFLDLPADRYFCLSREADRAVAGLLRDEIGDTLDRARLARLADDGLLVECDTARPIASCPAPPVATHSLVGTTAATGAADIAAALWHLVLATVELRIAGLTQTLARAERRKQRKTPTASAERIASTAAAFEACNALVSAHDRCLPRSLAIAHRLMSIGARPELVLAVKLGPFKAHAWVQCGDTLVNERVEVARPFTPILVL